MKTYEVDKINFDFTNLDFAKQFFPKAIFDGDNKYNLKNKYEIEWSGEVETFFVNFAYYDNEVGDVTNEDIFSGNFGQCIDFIKKETGHDIETKKQKNSPIKKFENKNCKITVEEITAFKFIATFWNKQDCYEVDRQVYEFETFGGATDKAFDLLTEIKNA